MWNVIGNLLWVFLGGIEVAACYAIGGVLLCLTIIGIPFGLKLFEVAVFALLPFGRKCEVVFPQNYPLSFLLNILWLPFGLVIAIIHLLFGIALCITIIGIPFGIQHFKLMSFVFLPFGRRVVE